MSRSGWRALRMKWRDSRRGDHNSRPTKPGSAGTRTVSVTVCLRYEPRRIAAHLGAIRRLQDGGVVVENGIQCSVRAPANMP